MDSAIVENGYIKVTRDGRFFRTYNGTECKLTKAKVRDRYYYYITYYTEIDAGKKQIQKLAHKLYAEAFIENNIGKNAVVMANDSNFLNITEQNLYWGTKTDRMNKYYEEIESDRVECVNCGDKFYKMKEVGMCGNCKRREKLKKENKKNKLQRIKESFANVNLSELTSKEKKMTLMRIDGLTFEEIGTECGISGEGARVILKRIREKGI